jgi:hypothetical protein
VSIPADTGLCDSGRAWKLKILSSHSLNLGLFISDFPNMMKTIQHHCPTLGADLVAEGDVASGIVSFRGIPYASVTKRWTQSSVKHSLPEIFDAAKFGPKCSQPTHTSLFQMKVAAPVVDSDEFKCLHLNVTVPSEALLGKGKHGDTLLPVLVWVHGLVIPSEL